MDIPNLTTDELDAARVKMCRWIYGSAQPFTIVEDKTFRAFADDLRPNFIPPSRYNVANKYLDREKQQLQSGVERSLQAIGHCTMSIDGAEDQGKESVSHVCALTPHPALPRERAVRDRIPDARGDR